MNVIQALTEKRVLGVLRAFRDIRTWRPWLVFLRAVYGLEMDAQDLELFRRFTGRQAPRPGGYPEAVVITGRQSGKSQIAATLAAFEAAMSRDRGTYALLLAQDFRGAQRVLFNCAREPFRTSPSFKRELVRETSDTLELARGTSLVVYPCRPSAVRGVRACIAVLDELAFYISGEGRLVDTEMLRAVRPTLATTGGKLIVLSSPYGQSGALWDLHRQNYGNAKSPCLVWQASAPEMNPTLPADYLARMERDDPEAYRSEVLGEFRAGLSTLLDPDALAACVIPGRRELAPAEETVYRAFVDPSGGRGDAFAVAVAHRKGSSVVLDCVRAWRAPFNPEVVIEECAALLRSYRVHEVVGDAYGGDFPPEQFQKRRVAYRVAGKDRSSLYLELLPVINAGGVELLDQPDLLRELRGLERRRGPKGKDQVDHRRGAHDDRANAVAGVVSILPGRRPVVPALPTYLAGAGNDDERDHEGAVADPGGALSEYQRRGRRRGIPDGW